MLAGGNGPGPREPIGSCASSGALPPLATLPSPAEERQHGVTPGPRAGHPRMTLARSGNARQPFVMGADYYDPSPRLRLAQPIVVAGQIGCGAPLVGRGVAARTGIRFAEVDRGIEHQAGRSLARIAHEEGVDAINARAERVITPLIERAPFGIIVLDKAWLPLSCSPVLKQATHLVHIDRPVQLLAERLPREVARSGTWLLRGAAPPDDEPGALEPILRERAPLLNAAHTLLRAEYEGESRIATLLLDSLTAISDAEPL